MHVLEKKNPNQYSDEGCVGVDENLSLRRAGNAVA